MVVVMKDSGIFTSIGLFKLKPGHKLFLDGKEFTHELGKIPGLLGGITYLSFNRQEIVEYLQWSDEVSFKAGIASGQYQQYIASVADETAIPATPSEVVFVDDARPGSDRFDAQYVLAKDDYITLISIFQVESGKRDEFIDLLQRDHKGFLRNFDGFVSAVFHTMIANPDGVIEVLQFESGEKMKAVPKSPMGRAHLGAISQLSTYSHNLYSVKAVFGGEPDTVLG